MNSYAPINRKIWAVSERLATVEFCSPISTNAKAETQKNVGFGLRDAFQVRTPTQNFSSKAPMPPSLGEKLRLLNQP